MPGLCENKALLSFESRRNTARGVAETLAGVNDPEIISEIISYLTCYGADKEEIYPLIRGLQPPISQLPWFEDSGRRPDFLFFFFF